MFSWYGKTHLLWKTRDLIVSDTGIAIQPTATFAECPDHLDILFVPGGFGMAAAMQDSDILAFLKDRSPRSDYVTSVCGGSLILGAAGLLQGYKPPPIGRCATLSRGSEQSQSRREWW